MKFTVKTRQNGKLETLEVEANDRQALWKELEARGIKSVVSIADGGTASEKSFSITPQLRKGLLAGVMIVAAAVVGYLLLFKGDEAPATKSGKVRSRQIKDAEGQVYPQYHETASVDDEPAASVKKKKPSFFVRVEKLPNGNEKRWTANGECYYVDLNRSREPGTPVYTNDVEAILAMYVHPGEDMPPPPDDDISDEEALAACSIPIYAFPDDTNEILREREAVNRLKHAMKKFIEEGSGNASDYIRWLIDRQNNEAKYVSQTRELVEELIRQDKCLVAAKFLKEMNERLAMQEIPPVRLTEDYQSVLDEAEATAEAEEGSDQ